MINYLLMVPVLASFFVTLFLIPGWIKRAKNAELIGYDIHKKNKTAIAESGGVTVIAGFALGVLTYIAINTFIFHSTKNVLEIFAKLRSRCSFLGKC